MKNKKKLIWFIVIIVGIIVISGVVFVNSKYYKYTYGNNLYEKGLYAEAIAVFEEIPDYKNTNQLMTECHNTMAYAFMEQHKYEEAIQHFILAEDEISEENIRTCYIMLIEDEIENGRYENAVSVIKRAGSKVLGEDLYKYTEQLYDRHFISLSYEKAEAFFDILPAEQYKENLMNYHKACEIEKNDVKKALELFGKIEADYRDVAAHVNDLASSIYQEAKELERTSYSEAIKLYKLIPASFKEAATRKGEVLKFEKIIGTYTLTERTIDNSVSNPNVSFLVDCYWDGNQTIVVIPDTFYEDWKGTRNCPISYSNGDYYVDMSSYNEDTTVTYSTVFSGDTMRLTHDVRLENGKKESDGFLSGLVNSFLDGWGVWLDSSTVEIWKKSNA